MFIIFMILSVSPGNSTTNVLYTFFCIYSSFDFETFLQRSSSDILSIIIIEANVWLVFLRIELIRDNSKFKWKPNTNIRYQHYRQSIRFWMCWQNDWNNYASENYISSKDWMKLAKNDLKIRLDDWFIRIMKINLETKSRKHKPRCCNGWSSERARERNRKNPATSLHKMCARSSWIVLCCSMNFNRMVWQKIDFLLDEWKQWWFWLCKHTNVHTHTHTFALYFW